MKKLIKHFTLLTAFVTMFAVCPVTAYAENTGSNNTKIDASLVFASETQLMVYVDGEWSANLSESYGFGDKATITAPEKSGNKVFSHWMVNDSIISYSRTLSLTMNAHTTIYAVYASTASTAQPVAGFTSITRTNEGNQISFQAIADKDATSAGIVYSTSASGDSLKIGGTGVTNVAAEKLTDSTTTLPKSILDNNGCWMLQIKPDSASVVYHARAYVTKNGTTTYGDVKNVSLSDLESGVSLVANLDGLDSENDLNSALAGLTNGMYTVTYDANGGTGTMASQAVLNGIETMLNANTFTRSGYIFNGWNTAANGSGTAYSDQHSVTLSGDITLYAQWTQTMTLTDGKYTQTATKTVDENTTYYTRFVFVKPKSEIAGKSKAVFTLDYEGRTGNKPTIEKTEYYTGMTTNGISYTPESENSIMLVVTVSSGRVLENLTCDIAFK